jgi:hypothetical protein
MSGTVDFALSENNTKLQLSNPKGNTANSFAIYANSNSEPLEKLDELSSSQGDKIQSLVGTWRITSPITNSYTFGTDTFSAVMGDTVFFSGTYTYTDPTLSLTITGGTIHNGSTGTVTADVSVTSDELTIDGLFTGTGTYGIAHAVQINTSYFSNRTFTKAAV